MSRLGLARRKYTGRNVPHGLFGPGLLLVHKPLVRSHFRIWWAARGRTPAVLHLPLEVWLYARFLRSLPGQLDYVPRNVRRRVLVHSVAWSVPPAHLLALGLDKRGAQILDYVHEQEIAGWHALRNRGARDVPVLVDKHEFARFAAAQGVPVVPTIAVVEKNSSRPLGELTDGDAFCKLRSGNQAAGAFAVFEAGGGRFLNGAEIVDVERAWRQLVSRGDVLVQPLLRNCAELQSLTDSEELITIRVITERGGGIMIALLEVPLHTGYDVSSIDAAAGRIGEVRVPGWDTILADSARLQSNLDVRSIAWDWAVTPDGPVLLEGNSGWSGTLPQVHGGGLLRSTT